MSCYSSRSELERGVFVEIQNSNIKIGKVGVALGNIFIILNKLIFIFRYGKNAAP